MNALQDGTGLTGTILRPGDDGYDLASTTFIGRGRPAVVVRPGTAADVANAVQYAAGADLEVSVKSGGHSGLMFGTNDGGLVIDLSSLADVEVLDLAERIVRVGAGATWGQVAARLAGHGLALTSGDTTSVGVGGLTLGGGFGWMVRKYGLTIDALLAAEVVTADGRVVRASAQEHGDLFWALRGGGGGFGVVTSFEFTAQPVGTVHAGTINLRLDDLAQLLKGWREAMRAAPEELSTAFIVMPAFGDLPAGVSVFACYAGEDGGSAARAFEPLLGLGTIVNHDLCERPYADVLVDAHAPPEGLRVEARNVLVDSLSDDVIAAIDAAYGRGDAGVVFLRSLGGAMARIAPEETAFAHRAAEALIVSGTFLPPGATDDMVEAALRPWHRVAAFGSGAYINFLTTSTPEDVAMAYPPATRARLAQLKRRYDPSNLFSRNHDIRLD